MTKQVLFIHSAGNQGLHEGSTGLAAYLKDALGEEYHFLSPDMPEPEDPAYSRWKEKLEKDFSGLDSEVILIGHSLGGSVLLKYLSEKTVVPSITGLFIVSSPYWGKETGWVSEDFTLSGNFASKLPPINRIFLYYSRGDEIVPSSHLNLYKQKLPSAEPRLINSDEHLFLNGLPELVEEIKKL
ncbi:alpha/beta fold hydrolase [Alkalicoccus halolimnae]|uniref:Alpha/beta fold hydrolase n=1 Tax=Alkalicoccus halolimnae TaxID=1667239 RepID=A0A5C7FDK1_9BACI|nr:alpha/beta fold hydrolase [Alkalicoccus halolimnae]TXF85377.1 alpha/beta fold hydrolase [Alkalicoccus halolimnae]